MYEEGIETLMGHTSQWEWDPTSQRGYFYDLRSHSRVYEDGTKLPSSVRPPSGVGQSQNKDGTGVRTRPPPPIAARRPHKVTLAAQITLDASNQPRIIMLAQRETLSSEG